MSASECPLCAGPGMRLGRLGVLVHYRCRNCGIVFNQEVPMEEDIEYDPLAEEEPEREIR